MDKIDGVRLLSLGKEFHALSTFQQLLTLHNFSKREWFAIPHSFRPASDAHLLDDCAPIGFAFAAAHLSSSKPSCAIGDSFCLRLPT
jgi:hypothetical protein